MKKEKKEKPYICISCDRPSSMLGYSYEEKRWVCAEVCLKAGKYFPKKK